MTKDLNLNVKLDPPTDQAIREYTTRHTVTNSEAVRRAFIVLQFLDEETRAGRKILTADHTGNTRSPITFQF